MAGGISYKMGEARNGISLCGLGTGGLQITTDGSFAHSTLQNNWMQELEQLLPGSFLAVHTSGVSGRCTRILQAEAPAGIRAIEDLTYCGHFPFADITYHDPALCVDISLEAFCPFTPYDAKSSAIPAIALTFKLANPTREAVQCSVAFSWTNDIGATEKRVVTGTNTVIEAVSETIINNSNAPVQGDGLTGVVMTTGRQDMVAGSEYAIAVLNAPELEVSVLPEWDATGDGQDFWGPFSDSGNLRPLTVPIDKTRDLRTASKLVPTGAVVASTELAPGEERYVTFVLAWFMPSHYDSGGIFLGHMYANWFDHAWDVARYVRENYTYLRDKSYSWQSLVYASSLPDYLKEALICQTYVLALSTWWVKDGRFALGETPGWLMEMAALRPYNMFGCLLFFPELAPQATELLAADQLQSGEIPTGLGRGCMDVPNYVAFRQQNSASFIINVYMDYLWFGGKAHLERMYESAKRAVQFAMTLDTDGDCIVNCNGIYDTAWDTWPVCGTAVYVAQFWLVALRAAQKMAELMGDGEFAAECRQWADTAIANFERQLWTGEYYALYRDNKLGDFSSTCFIGQLYGQLLGYLLGLGEILSGDRVTVALKTIEKLNVADTPFGGTTGVKPDGRRDLSSTINAQSHCVAPTEIFDYAAVCLYHGLPEVGLGVVEETWKFLEEDARDPWQSLLLLDADTGENFYGKHYIDNLNVWMILLAAEGLAFDIAQGLFVLKPNLDPLEAPIFSSFFYGTMRYESRHEGDEIIGLDLELVNMGSEPVQVRQFVTRFKGSDVSSLTFTSPTGETTHPCFEHDANTGELVILDELTLDIGASSITVER